MRRAPKAAAPSTRERTPADPEAAADSVSVPVVLVVPLVEVDEFPSPRAVIPGPVDELEESRE